MNALDVLTEFSDAAKLGREWFGDGFRTFFRKGRGYFGNVPIWSSRFSVAFYSEDCADRPFSFRFDEGGRRYEMREGMRWPTIVGSCSK